ncbi:MAG: bifunctional riboflavin kinase/FAD synthetase [Fibromonadaceae bacterium]|jgi:riboflavin kinase/FMN adenylyltransferase|nr:bifunctional riboflavin kinase/FAD synthetase [Fibromonadaceae bacterium]
MHSSIVLGNFDGCHLGHRALFEALKTQVKENGTQPIAISFEPHTRHVIQEPGHPELLTSNEEKKEIMEACGIPLVLQKFDKDLFAMPFRSFADEFAIKKYGAKLWIMGLDQRFGRGGKGNAESLKAYFHSLSIHEIAPVLFEGESISSSRIREALKNGNLDLANAMLGQSYSISGVVEHGLGQGKVLGFPTANLRLPSYKLLPKNGVYCGFASFEGQKHRAVINVGNRPSLGNRPVQLEAHLLNFDGDLYDKKLSVELARRLRDEIKFDSVEALKEQIKKDIRVSQGKLI